MYMPPDMNVQPKRAPKRCIGLLIVTTIFMAVFVVAFILTLTIAEQSIGLPLAEQASTGTIENAFEILGVAVSAIMLKFLLICFAIGTVMIGFIIIVLSIFTSKSSLLFIKSCGVLFSIASVGGTLLTIVFSVVGMFA